jgi:signal transduction histidine kinase
MNRPHTLFSSRVLADSLESRRETDSAFDSSQFDRGAGTPPLLSRWMGWRLRLLVAAALLGCMGLFLLARWLAEPLHVDAVWRVDANGRPELVATGTPELRPFVGQALLGLRAGSGPVIETGALALHRSARWVIDDVQRVRMQALQERLAEATAQAKVRLSFANGTVVETQTQRRGFAHLGNVFWLLAALAMALYMVAMVVLLAKPSMHNLLYAAMALCQSGNMVFIAIESTLDLGLPAPLPSLNMPLRMAFDMVTAAAMVNAACLHPQRLPGAVWIALSAWSSSAVMLWAVSHGMLSNTWSWAQAWMGTLALIAIGLLSWSYQIEPHPSAMVQRRFGMVALGTWVLLTLGLALSAGVPRLQINIATIGSMIWYVFLASLLLLVPFMSKSQQIMREFALLAGISTVATSLDLLFVAVFSFGQFASLTLSLFLSLAVYAGARQWIVNQLIGKNMLTTERMFEHLYRIAREVEARPERAAVLLSQLLRELFEPMEVSVLHKHTHATRIVADGSTMILPVPALNGGNDDTAQAVSVMLRFAQRGRRLFTSDDARLTDRIVEQLRRAVAFERAVEQGRSEERMRLAQDLHDDIGARLLTLMYKAHDPEMEEYVRHTLQDLKTLTRGLAASNHRLSHAAAEWKSDLSHRLSAANIELIWKFSFDIDLLLSVGQWSALTRVLRELVSNTIAHAQAIRVEIDFHLEGDRLDLSVADDGHGRNPRAWSHGLGLGGVRKRVKQLGGEVEWREISPNGISCRVIVRELSTRN